MSKVRRVRGAGGKLPDYTGYGGVRGLTYKVANTDLIQRNKEQIAKEVLLLAGSDIADVLEWDERGNVRLKPKDVLTPEITRTIRKLKCVTVRRPDGDGGEIETTTLEVELHDKMAALRIAAKAAGYLDGSKEIANRPTVVGIQIKAPHRGEDEPVVTEYEVLEG